MITEYAVKVPNQGSLVTKIGFTFDRHGKNDGIIITEHTLFDALPDDSKLFIVTEEDYEDWFTKEVITESSVTVKDLRDLRKKFINNT